MVIEERERERFTSLDLRLASVRRWEIEERENDGWETRESTEMPFELNSLRAKERISMDF